MTTMVHLDRLALSAGATSSKISNAAIIAIAVVGGVVLLVLLTVIFCCCRSRYKAQEAAAVGAVADKAPQPKVVTPAAPEPFSVNYPQIQVRLTQASSVTRCFVHEDLHGCGH